MNTSNGNKKLKRIKLWKQIASYLSIKKPSKKIKPKRSNVLLIIGETN